MLPLRTVTLGATLLLLALAAAAGRAATLSYTHVIGAPDGAYYLDVDMDADGNAYAVGARDNGSFFEVWVAKLDAVGGRVLWQQTLGGASESDYGLGIAVDELGNVFVVGQANSADFATPGVIQSTPGGAGDAFVARLDGADGTLVYVTYLGGIGHDFALGVDAVAGEAYVTGQVDRGSLGFPETEPFGASGGAFVAHLDASGANLHYSICLVCSSGAVGVDISVDAAGQAHVVGDTGSGFASAFVRKLTADGTDLLYQRRWPQSIGRGIAVDAAGAAHVTGQTRWENFPASNPFIGGDEDCPNCSDAFALKLEPDGDIDWSLLLASTGDDGGRAIDVDLDGNVVVAGLTTGDDFPLQNPVQDLYGGGFSDVFVTRISPTGDALLLSTYLGGTKAEGPSLWYPDPMGVAVDAFGNPVVVGYSDSPNFPGRGAPETLAANDIGFAAAIVDLRCEDTTGDGLRDSDGDGLCDNWESAGIDIDDDGTVELPLHAPGFGADPLHKDIFVEVDFMYVNAAHSHRPQPGVYAEVARAFDRAPVLNPDGTTGIRVHFMEDEKVPEVNPTDLIFDTVGGVLADFFDLKSGDPYDPCGIAPNDGHFGPPDDRVAVNCMDLLRARRMAFHYAIFGHDLNDGSSGVAEMVGNDLLVTVGGFPAKELAQSGNSLVRSNAQRNIEAGTLMHELGHNLGLDHGGGDDVNCKPNYVSVMNYTLQLLEFDPTRPLDYSRQELPGLVESSLDEPLGIQGPIGRSTVYGVGGSARIARAFGPIDWNDDGDATDSGVDEDPTYIADTCDEQLSTGLSGHDDWANIVLPFRDGPYYADRVSSAGLPVERTQSVSAQAGLVDFDGDGIPNYPDNCAARPNPMQEDGDGDLTGDVCDTCTLLANPSQLDLDFDGFGNACDCDFDNDLDCDSDDETLFLVDLGLGVDSGIGSDMDASGVVDDDDRDLFETGLAAGAPGPSAVPEPGAWAQALAVAACLAALGRAGPLGRRSLRSLRSRFARAWIAGRLSRSQAPRNRDRSAETDRLRASRGNRAA